MASNEDDTGAEKPMEGGIEDLSTFTGHPYTKAELDSQRATATPKKVVQQHGNPNPHPVNPSSKSSPTWQIASVVATDAIHFTTSLYRNIYVLVTLFVIGLSLDELRIALVWISPWVSKHWATISKAWNVIGSIIEEIVKFMAVTFDAVIKLFSTIKTLFGGKAIQTHASVDAFTFVAEATDVFDEIFYTLPRECGPYSSGFDIIGGMFHLLASEQACYYVRAFYPTVGRDYAEYLLQTSTNGRDYAPVLLGPDSSDGLCILPGEPMNWLCVAFGAGVVILEILIPLMLIGITLTAFRQVIFGETLYIAVMPVTMAAEGALGLVEAAAKRLTPGYA